MNVSQVIPVAATDVDLSRVLQRLAEPESRSEPFNDAIFAFCVDLSRALFRDPQARAFPELQALAFWMRKGELLKLKREFEALQSDGTLLVPRGLVFHVPPSNVDTIFVYSWLMSVLSGNTNVIRLSDRAGAAANAICRVFGETLATADASVTANTVVLRYGHDDAITGAISAACDVRVVWGGDTSVNAIRGIALPPHAKEMTFPDRYSLAVLSAGAYLRLDDSGRRDLASRFYNDTFWFDQMACSSPRLVVWIGAREERALASAFFYEFLEHEVQGKGYELAVGPRLNKLTFGYRAILDRPVASYQTFGSEVTVLHLEDIAGFSREHCGGGLLFQAYAATIDEVTAIVGRREQTLTHFGFSADELRAFARKLNGRGIDRCVPIGQALSFHRFWDGYDLLREFIRTVYIQA